MRQTSLAAQQASYAKDEFLANMSHEIRTPLNAVVGILQLIAKTDLSDQQSRYISSAGTSADALLRLVDQILDLASIEKGKVELEASQFEVRKMLQRVISSLAASAEAKGLSLVVDVREDVPQRTYADQGRLQQVVTNLVGNAIKFTSSGTISVELSTVSDGDDVTGLRFDISDTGDGIKDTDFARIFDPFVQADCSATRNYGGTGLGLAIAKKLVSAMGGGCRRRQCIRPRNAFLVYH